MRLPLTLAALCGSLVAPARGAAQGGDSASMEARVAESVCDRQVVVLGELPSHGEGRAFAAKARIVEHLVTRCGFGAVLFEAPIYDFLGFEEAVAGRTAVPLQLDRAIGGFWWTRELSEWRRWLFERSTQGGVVLGGIDDQPSATSHHARAVLPRLVGGALPVGAASECEQAVARNLQWRYDETHRFDDAEQERLARCAGAAVLRVRGDASTVRQGQRAMIENLAGYYARGRGSAGARDRDEVMYRNVRWYEARMPGAGKYIVWTATVHAARRQGELPVKPLGAWLAEQWGERVAVIGFSAFAGQSSRAGSPSKEISEAPAGSLEALATGADKAFAFLDAGALRAIGAVPSRLFGRFVSAEWGELFDGVVVIREEVAPMFEVRR